MVGFSRQSLVNIGQARSNIIFCQLLPFFFSNLRCLEGFRGLDSFFNYNLGFSCFSCLCGIVVNNFREGKRG
jgi:hypothetical protein